VFTFYYVIVIVFLLFSFNTRLFRGVAKARFRVVEVIDIHKKDIFGWSRENTRNSVGFLVFSRKLCRGWAIGGCFGLNYRDFHRMSGLRLQRLKGILMIH
jgi:hypothetical protein